LGQSRAADEIEHCSLAFFAAALVPMLRQANRQAKVGGTTHANREVAVGAGGFLRDGTEVGGYGRVQAWWADE